MSGPGVAHLARGWGLFKRTKEMFKKRKKMRWQQPQKQERHPTELYALWSHAESAQMAESEVTGWGEEPAWRQEPPGH